MGSFSSLAVSVPSPSVDLAMSMRGKTGISLVLNAKRVTGGKKVGSRSDLLCVSFI